MRNPIRVDEWRLFYDLPVGRMLELGNKKNSALNQTYKSFFVHEGYEHVSVDWNGQDGALKLDLRKPLDLGTFDVVTNIGTTEHVEGQPEVWENIHNAVKLGGVFISVTPKGDGKNWPRHGFFYPKHEFFERFAIFNGYKIEELYDSNNAPVSNTYCRLKKIRSRNFRMPSMDTFYVNDPNIYR